MTHTLILALGRQRQVIWFPQFQASQGYTGGPERTTYSCLCTQNGSLVTCSRVMKNVEYKQQREQYVITPQIGLQTRSSTRKWAFLSSQSPQNNHKGGEKPKDLPGKPLPLPVTRENTDSNETVENCHLTGKTQYHSGTALLRLWDNGSSTQPGGASWSTTALLLFTSQAQGPVSETAVLLELRRLRPDYCTNLNWIFSSKKAFLKLVKWNRV